MNAKRTLGLTVAVVLGLCSQSWSAHAEGDRHHGERHRPKSNLPYPKSVAGFSGMVWGQVINKKPNGLFTFKVKHIKEVWRTSKAADPYALEGKTINVARGQNKSGRPDKLHLKYINRLEKGEQIRLEIKHFAETNFLMLELDWDQRRIALGGDKEEGEHAHWKRKHKWRKEHEEERARREEERERHRDGKHHGDRGERHEEGDRGDRHEEGKKHEHEEEREKHREEGEREKNVDNDYDD